MGKSTRREEIILLGILTFSEWKANLLSDAKA